MVVCGAREVEGPAEVNPTQLVTATAEDSLLAQEQPLQQQSPKQPQGPSRKSTRGRLACALGGLGGTALLVPMGLFAVRKWREVYKRKKDSETKGGTQTPQQPRQVPMTFGSPIADSNKDCEPSRGSLSSKDQDTFSFTPQDAVSLKQQLSQLSSVIEENKRWVLACSQLPLPTGLSAFIKKFWGV